MTKNQGIVSGSVLSAVIVIFVMLFNSMNSDIKDEQQINRQQGERLATVETETEGIDDKVDELRIEQREIKHDVKEILKKLD